MSYNELLKTEQWKERRLKIIARDNDKCQASSCKSVNSHLQVHHREYLSYELNPWEYPDDMLITLCNVCHKKENTRLKID
jgi:5-methylcytosine-specific restriction endonuclease McrA